MVFCINKSFGCTWSGEMKDVMLHLMSCEHDQILCPKDCGHKIQRSNWLNHIQSQCNKIQFKCQQCGVSVEGGKLADHNAVCPKFPVQCPFLCKSQFFNRELLAGHLNEECKLNLEKCEFSAIGCQFNGPVFQHEEHMKNYVQEHFMLACATIVKMEQRIIGLEQRIRDIDAIFWKITDFSTKFKKDTDYAYSDIVHLKPCYYFMKFALSLSPPDQTGGDIFYSFYFQIHAGPYDSFLSWPFNAKLKVTIVNQVQNLKDKSFTFEYNPNERTNSSVRSSRDLLQRPKIQINLPQINNSNQGFSLGSVSLNHNTIRTYSCEINNIQVHPSSLFCFQKVREEHIDSCLHNDSLLIKIETI